MVRYDLAQQGVAGRRKAPHIRHMGQHRQQMPRLLDDIVLPLGRQTGCHDCLPGSERHRIGPGM